MYSFPALCLFAGVFLQAWPLLLICSMCFVTPCVQSLVPTSCLLATCPFYFSIALAFAPPGCRAAAETYIVFCRVHELSSLLEWEHPRACRQKQTLMNDSNGQ